MHHNPADLIAIQEPHEARGFIAVCRKVAKKKLGWKKYGISASSAFLTAVGLTEAAPLIEGGLEAMGADKIKDYFEVGLHSTIHMAVATAIGLLLIVANKPVKKWLPERVDLFVKYWNGIKITEQELKLIALETEKEAEEFIHEANETFEEEFTKAEVETGIGAGLIYMGLRPYVEPLLEQTNEMMHLGKIIEPIFESLTIPFVMAAVTVLAIASKPARDKIYKLRGPLFSLALVMSAYNNGMTYDDTAINPVRHHAPYSQLVSEAIMGEPPRRPAPPKLNSPDIGGPK